MAKRGEHTITRHHRLPRSRGGSDDPENIVMLDKSFHRAWHHCFANLTIEEVHRFIDIVMSSGEEWHHSHLSWFIENMRGE